MPRFTEAVIAPLGREPTVSMPVMPGAETGLRAPVCSGPVTDSMAPEHGPMLSTRHLSVLRLVADDLTNEEIAAQLGLSPSTVKGHLQNICSRLGVRSRIGAVVRAYRLGLLRAPWAGSELLCQDCQERLFLRATLDVLQKRLALARDGGVAQDIIADLERHVQTLTRALAAHQPRRSAEHEAA